jgi:galactonate dehydratase
LYRHAFYRGGPILTSVLSGIDMGAVGYQGKALGMPVHELLGGPTRNRIRVYSHARTPADMKRDMAQGFSAFKTGPAKRRGWSRYVDTPGDVQFAIENFASCARPSAIRSTSASTSTARFPGNGEAVDQGAGTISPMFVEEPINCQNHDLMAEIARGTHLPIATGERVFTKWGFRDVLEKKAATILQPDLCHAGGISEVRLIAGMAEAYYASIAPHNPLGPISSPRACRSPRRFRIS